LHRLALERSRNPRGVLHFLVVRVFLVVLAFVLMLAESGCGSRAGLGSKPSRLTVSAAISLKEALEEIRKLYQRDIPVANLTLNFGASGTLEQQIEQGASVDVFISASPHEMDALAVKGLVVEESRRDLVKNEVVLVAPRDSALVSGFDDLRKPEVNRVAMGDPEIVPAGRYAREVLTYLHIFDNVQPKLIFTKDVRQALAYAATGNVEAALVYPTEVGAGDNVKIVARAPSGSHEPIVYPVAALKTQRDPGGAIAFVRFLLAKEVQSVFARHGFIPALGER
jgi:molybdate transport system substrate-binding protein